MLKTIILKIGKDDKFAAFNHAYFCTFALLHYCFSRIKAHQFFPINGSVNTEILNKLLRKQVDDASIFFLKGLIAFAGAVT